MEAFDGIQENIALVDRPANGCAIVHSDSEEGIQRLNQEAAKVMAHAQQAGMEEITPEHAIRWLTANPAKAMGIADMRSEEHTSELQSLMRISYAVFCLKKKKKKKKNTPTTTRKNNKQKRKKNTKEETKHK